MLWRLMSKANRLDEPAHDGLPARPSLMRRVELIEDRLGHIEDKLAELTERPPGRRRWPEDH